MGKEPTKAFKPGKSVGQQIRGNLKADGGRSSSFLGDGNGLNQT